MSTEQRFDEKAEFKELQSQFQKLAKPFEAIAKLKLSDPEVLDKWDAALKTLPSAEQMSKALDEVTQKAVQTVAEARRSRAQSFGRLESAFIKTAEAAGKAWRELDNGWRIGGLELQVNREQSKARVLVNREELCGWTAIRSSEDLQALVDKAQAMLHKAALPEAALPDLFWNAYDQAREQRKRQGAPSPHRVPMRELYQELVVSFVRREFTASKGGPKLSKAELPLWAFLYNLDRYRAIASTIGEANRLALETGSQKEAQGLGVVVNGLDARRDYQVMCYVVAVRG